MKKEYKKPEIVVETFELSEHIASCGVPHESEWGTPLKWSKETCAWQDAFGTAIFVDPKICSYLTEGSDFLCYNNPEGGITIFGS